MPKVLVRADAGGNVRAGRPLAVTYRVLGSRPQRRRCVDQSWRSTRVAVAPPVPHRSAARASGPPGREGDPFLDAAPALERLVEQAAHFGGDGVAALALSEEQREDALWVTVSGTLVHLEDGTTRPVFTTHLDVGALAEALVAGLRPCSAVVLEGTAGGHEEAGPGEDEGLTAQQDALLREARTALGRAVPEAHGHLLLIGALAPVVRRVPCPLRVAFEDPRFDVGLELRALGTVLAREGR